VQRTSSFFKQQLSSSLYLSFFPMWSPQAPSGSINSSAGSIDAYKAWQLLIKDDNAIIGTALQASLPTTLHQTRRFLPSP
jgi:hypothetical protein